MKKLLLSFLSIVCAVCAYAQFFEIDNLGYEVLDADNHTVSVGMSYSGKPTGELTIPAKVTYDNTEYTVVEIIDYAFYDCRNLTSVKIPNSVISIGSGVFSECGSLNGIICAEDNPKYCAKGGVLFNKDLTVLIQYPGGKAGNYKIPNSVTTIGDEAFAHCDGLTSVEIPNAVTTIGDEAFAYCVGLTSVEIPNSVTTIGDGAFNECVGLTSVKIPNSVISIGSGVFVGCGSLNEIICAEDNPKYCAKDGVLFNKDLTVLIQHPGGKAGNYKIPGTVTTIGDYAFRSCTDLTSVEIPNSVTTIGDNAFEYCPSLTLVVIPNSVTAIGDWAFCECTGLTSVEIPNSVTTIPEGVFCNCTGLTSVVIPNSVTTIGDVAFCNCTGLTSIVIPNSVTTIGYWAFADCSGLTSVYYNCDTPVGGDNGIFEGAYSTATLYVPAAAIELLDSPWIYFDNIQAYDFNGIEDITADIDMEAPAEVYNLSGVKVATSAEALPKGIYVVRQGGKSIKVAVK